jgi:hypothetical protein
VGDVSGLAQNYHYVDMRYITDYTFRIRLTNIKPKNQQIWMSYQFGEALTDFYYTCVYEVGGLTQPLLTITASSTFMQWQGQMAEIYFDINGLPASVFSTTQKVLIEVSATGMTANLNSMAYHNATNAMQGPVAQIDCLCRYGGTGAYASFSCYNTYIVADDQNLATTPYIAIMTPITASRLECYIPYFNVKSGATGLSFTAKIADPQYRFLWYDSVASKYRVQALYQGKTASPVTFVSQSPFLTASPQSGVTVNGAINTAQTFTLNVTNGTYGDVLTNQWYWNAGDVVFFSFDYGAPTLTSAFCSGSAGGGLNCIRIYSQVNQGCYCTVATVLEYYQISATLTHQANAWGAPSQT